MLHNLIIKNKGMLTFFFITFVAVGYLFGSSSEIEINQRNIMQGKSVHQPTHGIGWIQKTPESNNSIKLTNSPNTSGWADKYGTPPYYVEINEQGFRDHEIKSNDSIRILVIGDSHTFGSGVNRSDTYVEVAEKIVNKRLKDSNVEIINAGIGGTGAKDYYLLMKDKGLKLNPDLVVIGFIPNDWLPHEMAEKLLINSIKTSDYSSSVNLEKGRNREVKEIYHRKTRKKKRNKSLRLEQWNYLHKIAELNEDNNIETSFYYIGLGKVDPVAEKVLKENNLDYFRRPNKLQKEDVKWKISKYDGHPNPRAHEVLASKLVDHIYPKIKTDFAK